MAGGWNPDYATKTKTTLEPYKRTIKETPYY